MRHEEVDGRDGNADPTTDTSSCTGKRPSTRRKSKSPRRHGTGHDRRNNQKVKTKGRGHILHRTPRPPTLREYTQSSHAQGRQKCLGCWQRRSPSPEVPDRPVQDTKPGGPWQIRATLAVFNRNEQPACARIHVDDDFREDIPVNPWIARNTMQSSAETRPCRQARREDMNRTGKYENADARTYSQPWCFQML